MDKTQPQKVFSKPTAFQDVFSRKPGADQSNTHYCPGCGHGIVHKLVAEALSDLDLVDRTIMVAPVGCAVFLYYYFDCAAVSVPHGRAPASLTAISRAHPEAISISYQGDGDLAAIGLSEIVHAANRGESMAVFFVNNAVYGMTGGQLAPTSLVGMPTTTSPEGRDAANDGYPMRMSELIATLESPVYVERVSLEDPPAIMRTRRAVRKALKAQNERKGFTFVEILSPCPTYWRVDPAEAGQWLRDHMHPVFPPGVYKDVLDRVESRPLPRPPASVEEIFRLLEVDDTPAPMQREMPMLERPIRHKLAGFGGQGILRLGEIVAQAGTDMGYHVIWLPSYGPEVRGGTSNTSVVLSPEPIGSPLVTESDVLIAMNEPSLTSFYPEVCPGGQVFYNSSIVDSPPAGREGIRMYAVPAQEIAVEVGNVRTANTVMLGAYNAVAKVFDAAAIEQGLARCFRRPDLVAVNREALAAGETFARDHLATSG